MVCVTVASLGRCTDLSSLRSTASGYGLEQTEIGMGEPRAAHSREIARRGLAADKDPYYRRKRAHTCEADCEPGPPICHLDLADALLAISLL